MKKFVPFDSFEKACSPKGKTLHETMQENVNAVTDPVDPAPCGTTPCPPYWQPTGVERCLSNGLVDIEEKDGCGNTRWTRSTGVVVWTNTDVTQCDEPNNRIQQQQINQCGDLRLIPTATLCCTPNWVDIEGEPENCEQSMLRVRQEDGCGHERWRSVGQAVNWSSTGEARCQPGDIYEIEQINQCGETRWFQVGVGCPCIPDWTDFGSQRCTGEFVEQNQVDGCGASRWHNTGVLVAWMPTGEQRCSATSFFQYEQVSQCGTTRWFQSEEPCLNSPPPNEADYEFEWSYCNSSGRTTTLTLQLNASTRLLQLIKQTETGGTEVLASMEWVGGTVDRSHYEARITYSAEQPAGDRRVYSGSTPGEWYNLGDETVVGGSFSCTGSALDPRMPWDFTFIRLDIRRVGYPIEGGAGVGPLRVVGSGDCYE